MKYYIKHHSTYNPKQIINIADLAKVERFIGEVKNLQEKGYDSLFTSPNTNSATLAADAVLNHIDEFNINVSEIGLVIYCHYWNDEEWNELHTFSVHNKLGLQHDTLVFEVKSGNQTSVFQAMDIAFRYLDTGMDKDILIVCADKIDTRFVRRKVGGGVFGDGASVITVSKSPSDVRIVSPIYSHVSSKFFKINQYDDEDAEEVEVELDKVGTYLTQSLEKNHDLQKISQVITHNYHISDIENGMEKGNINADIYRGTIATHAHVPTAGYLLNLDHFIRTRNESGQILLWGSAMGASCSACLIEINR